MHRATSYVTLAVVALAASLTPVAANAQSASSDGRPGEFEVGYSQLSISESTLTGLNITWTLGDSANGGGLIFGIDALSKSYGSGASLNLTLASVYGGLKLVQRDCSKICGFGQVSAGGTGIELESHGAVALTDKAFMIEPAAGADWAASERVGVRVRLGWRATLTEIDNAAKGFTFGIGLTFGRW